MKTRKLLFTAAVILFALTGAAFAAIVNPVAPVVSAGKYLYIPNQTTNKIYIYDTTPQFNITPEAPTLKGTIETAQLGGQPACLALSSDGNKLYVSTINGYLREFNKDGAYQGSFSGATFQELKGIALSPDGSKLYAVDSIAQKVYVFNASSRTLIGNPIPVNVPYLFSVAVSPDNTKLAVVQRMQSGSNSQGKIYLYNIGSDGSYTLAKTITSASSMMVYPSYVAFSPEGDRLFVRVTQAVSPYADVLIYSGTNFGTESYISFVQADEKDPLNTIGEAMALSPSGEYLYLTHYRTSLDSGENATALKKVHLYRIPTYAGLAYRTNWMWTPIREGNIYDQKLYNVIPPSIDGLCVYPTGSKLWLTDSSTGKQYYTDKTAQVLVSDEAVGIHDGTAQSWGYVYSTITVKGQGFGANEGKIKVGSITIPGSNTTAPARIYDWRDSQVVFGVPRSIEADYIEPGENDIQVITSGGNTLLTIPFTVRPKVFSNNKPVSPASGPVGTEIKIYGFGFGGEETPVDVYFNDGNKVSTKVASRASGIDTLEVVTVPSGLSVGTAYPVKIVSNSQVSNNNYKFTVTDAKAPVIDSVLVSDETFAIPTTAQNWGYVYSTVTIKGSNLGYVNGKLLLGDYTIQNGMLGATVGTGAAVRDWYDDQIVFVVPRYITAYTVHGPVYNIIKAGQHNISITNQWGLTQASPTSFSVNPRVYSETGPVTPEAAPMGSKIRVYGFGFGAKGDTVQVKFGDSDTNKVATTVASSEKEIDWIDVRVPKTGLQVGTSYSVEVTTNDKKSNNQYKFTVVNPQAPVITSILVSDEAFGINADTPQNWGYAYSTVTINGSNLGYYEDESVLKLDSNYVQNMTSHATLGTSETAAVRDWNDNRVIFVIPRQAIGGGIIDAGKYSVNITNQWGLSDASAKSFTIKQKIENTKPVSGPVGSRVSVFGYFVDVPQTKKAPLETEKVFVQFIEPKSGDIAAAVESTVASRETLIDRIDVNVPNIANGNYQLRVLSKKIELEPLASNKHFPFKVRDAQPLINTIEVYDENLGINTTNEAWGYVFSTVTLKGQDFGTEEGKVKLGDLTISNSGNTTIPVRVYTWEADSIVFGIPRSIEGTLINPGQQNITIETHYPNGILTQPFAVRPKIYSDKKPIDPDSGAVSQTIDIYGFGFGSLNSDVLVSFESQTLTKDALAKVASREGIDRISVVVPATLALGSYNVKVTSNSQISNNNNTYTVTSTSLTPKILSFEVDKNTDPNINEWVATDEAAIYDHIRIVGENFGNPGSTRDTSKYNVKIGDVQIRDEGAAEGLRVYAWSDTSIEVVIPRRDNPGLFGTPKFINGGPNNVVVKVNSVDTSAAVLKIKPKIYSVSPQAGPMGSTVKVVGIALGKGTSSRTVSFGAIPAGEGTITQNPGQAPDGAGDGATDEVTVTVPQGLVLGWTPVTVDIGSVKSNSDITFEVTELKAPVIQNIVPNAAPNKEDVTVDILGYDFTPSLTTVMLKKTGEPDITGTVDQANSTSEKIKVLLLIKDKNIGKYDVVLYVTGLVQPVTRVKGFTILGPTDEATQIIDDFEGVLVAPDKYTSFKNGESPDPNAGELTFALQNTVVDEGDQSGSIVYAEAPNDLNYRGYNAYLTASQDVTSYNTLVFHLKGNGSDGNKIKLQVTGGDGSEYRLEDANSFALTDASGFIKYSIPFTSLIKYVGNNPTGQTFADLTNKVITNYQVVITGKPGNTTPVYIDYVAAVGKGVLPSETTTTISRTGDTVGSGVVIGWMFNDGYAGPADIYTVSGVWDAVDAVFTTDASKWTKEFSGVVNTITDNDQVGKGTQKYYKVVKTGVSLDSGMLANEVVGKFDIGMTTGYNLISLPIIASDSNINNAIGAQMQAGPVPPLSDKVYKNKADGSGYVQVWLNSVDNKWYDAETMTESSISIDPDTAYWLELADGHDNAMPTFVGKVSSVGRTMNIISGFNFVGTTYPVKVGIENSNLRESGATAGMVPPLAAKVYYFKDDKTGFGQIWLNSSDNKWYDAETMMPLNLDIKPGKGYLIEEVESVQPYTWQYPKPY